jgi:N-carbamoylputrescine amidase
MAADSPGVVRVGLVQTHASEDPSDNVERTLRLIDRAAKDGAQVVCTQELFRSRYFCQAEDASFFSLAEPIPGPTTKALSERAKRHGIPIIGSLFERRAPGLFHNTAVVLDADGSLLGLYRKMHIPDDPRFYEKFYFAPGDLGFRSFDTRAGRVGTLVCWDQWYPEAARLTALSGAEILFYPTAIGWLPDEKEEFGASQHSAWETMMRSHAIANGLFVAAPNRVGREGKLQFWGGSFISDPNGNLLAKGQHEGEEIVIAQCDLGLIDVVRTHWPFLRDRRIDAYGDITKRYRDGS